MTLQLDYLSPLPPVRSGISDYSVDLLEPLARLCDVRVLRLPGQEVAGEVAERWSPRAAEEALTTEARRAERERRLPLHQMGNNRYHEAVAELAGRFPGVLTLHDLVLHHLLTERTLGRGEWIPYREALAADHGFLGDVVAVPRRWGGYSDAALFSLPAHRDLLRRQRGVLVHSRWAAEQLAEEDPELRVRAVPMGIPLPPPPDAAAGRTLRQRFGVPEGAPLLGSFGFQTPIKRTDVAIAALARPGLEAVHLLIVGQVSEHADLEGAARRAGVAERVHVMGFVDFAEFESAIAAVDLCLNLRYPTAGETSASLLRVLAVGRPAIVSDYAQFAELPAAAALKVPLGGDEVPALAARLAELLAAPERLAEMGRAARRHVEQEHEPARAAAAVVAACEAWRELTPPGPDPFGPGRLEGVPVAAPPPSTLTWSTLSWSPLDPEREPSGGQLRVEVAEAGASELLPWPCGERRRLRLTLRNTSPCRWLAGEAGPGGVALQVQLLVAGEGDLLDLLADRPWLPLPRPLAPGEQCRLEVAVRKPPGPATLRFLPHVLGGGGFGSLGGPVWQQEI